MISTLKATNGTNGNGHKGSNGKGNGRGPGKNRISNDSGDGNGKPAGKGGKQSGGSRGPCAADIELAVQRWETAKAQAKELYSTADTLESELVSALGVGGSLTLTDGRVVRIVNNFVDANGTVKMKHFGLAGVRQFELKIK